MFRGEYYIVAVAVAKDDIMEAKKQTKATS